MTFHAYSDAHQEMLDLSEAKKIFLKPHLLGGKLGQPYVPPDGCEQFLYEAFEIVGIPTTRNIRRDASQWRRLSEEEKPQYGDVVLFRGLPFARYHIGLMLDRRSMIQSSPETNGVARIEIDREPWAMALHGFFRRKCS